jgi:hypothetical protein
VIGALGIVSFRGIPETAFPEPFLLTETENTSINDILALLNKHGLTSHQSQTLLEQLGRINYGDGAASGEGHDALTRRMLWDQCL